MNNLNKAEDKKESLNWIGVLLNFTVKIIKFFLERSSKKIQDAYENYKENRNKRIDRTVLNKSVDDLVVRQKTNKSTKGLTSLRSKS
jgi:hypothetical protein